MGPEGRMASGSGRKIERQKRPYKTTTLAQHQRTTIAWKPLGIQDVDRYSSPFIESLPFTFAGNVAT
jgi:hypothetical protein